MPSHAASSRPSIPLSRVPDDSNNGHLAISSPDTTGGIPSSRLLLNNSTSNGGHRRTASNQQRANTAAKRLVEPNQLSSSSVGGKKVLRHQKLHSSAAADAAETIETQGLLDNDELARLEAEAEAGYYEAEPGKAMPSDLRPPYTRPMDGRSQQPLLNKSRGSPPLGYEAETPHHNRRRSAMRERDPEAEAKAETRKRYTCAAFFLIISLISFVIQTETAVHVSKPRSQGGLGWQKSYCMLYMTHGSWALLWPVQLLILRLYDLRTPWRSFWRRHVQMLTTTAQMVRYQTLNLNARQSSVSPRAFMIKTVSLVTCALTVAGGSWYIAVRYTSGEDLTAIYNCSAFFAYAFSIPLLREKVRFSKVFAVFVAIGGVLIIAYGGDKKEEEGVKDNRFLGNVIIGIGSVLYGFYEVFYKKVACPPDGCSPARGVVFANTIGAGLGAFTLLVLWIPLPVLHYAGIESFELPKGDQARVMAISVVANATFSGSFLVLISLTSPVLSSVASLLTIFLVAIFEQIMGYSKLGVAEIVGGVLIIGAFSLLSWSSYKEMQEERKHEPVYDIIEDSELED